MWNDANNLTVDCRGGEHRVVALVGISSRRHHVVIHARDAVGYHVAGGVFVGYHITCGYSVVSGGYQDDVS